MTFAVMPNLDQVLKPIPGSNPAGRDARDGKNFDLLKEARREEDALNQGEWKRDAKVADWSKAIELATGILESESKDLQVAAWLVEGLLRQYGFPGLTQGFRLLHGIHHHFWESLYPPIEDGDLEFRSGKLEALNKVLPYAIRNVPLLQSGDGSRYSYAHYLESLTVENLKRAAVTDSNQRKRLEEALKEGKVEGEKIDKAIGFTPLPQCTAILDRLSETWEAYNGLTELLEEKYGEFAPNLRAVQDTLADCRSFMDQIVKKKGGSGLVASDVPVDGTSKDTSSPVQPTISPSIPGVSGPIKDRAEALRRLGEISEFFRKTEPHSPVSYLVQRAVRWGDMSLEQWLQEVIKDDGVLKVLRDTLGIKVEGASR